MAETTSQWNHCIYVTPSNGSNTPGCGNLTSPCGNLSYALQLTLRKPSTVYILSPGTHYLDNTTYLHPFTLDGLGITGNGSQSIVECTGPNAGVSFVNASNVLLENITFSNCAALQNSTSRNFSSPLNPLRMCQFYAGLYFNLCENISISRVEVTDSPNATGVAMFDTTGRVIVTQSNFTNNTLEESNHNFPGGGGFYVEFSYCVPEEYNCTSPPASGTSNSSYTFEGCIFTNNSNRYIPGKYYVFFTLPRGTFHDAFGRGGGLSIFFKRNATENKFQISNCQFVDNTAAYGGGLAVSILDNATKNSLKMENCLFTCNTGNVTGGGIDVFYAVVENKGSNIVTVLSTTFTYNTAGNGGAFSLLVTSQSTTNDQVVTVSLGNCSFENNRATVGSAVYLGKYLLFVTENTPTVEISSSEFAGNQILRSTDDTYIHREGIAAVYVNKVPIRFRHYVHFADNKGSALGVVGSHVDFRECSATFVRNTGFQGGAIALLGAAWIDFNNATSMSFISNWAVTNGGAIYNKYIEKEDLRDFSRCFLSYEDLFTHPDDWNATFFFWNNSAGIHGNSIYSTSIFPCAKESSSPSNASGIFCWKNWTWRNSPCESQIGTDVGKITITDDLVKTFPGKVFFVPVDVYDDLEHKITKQTVFATTTKNTSSVTVDSKFQYVSHGSVRLLGVGNATLEVDTISNRAWQINIKVELQPCPPGLVPTTTGNDSFCVCSGNYGGKVECDNKNFSASLTSGYWMGFFPHNQSSLAVGLCYKGFCSLATTGETLLRLPNSTANLDMHICSQQNRTGVMCGECLKHNGPAVNTDAHQCVYCKDINTTASIMYYVVLVYVPLFLLFMFIILFNVRLTSGPANAFILYSQVIASSFSVDGGSYSRLNTLLDHSKQLIRGYKALCGVFNLEFIEKSIQPMCLGTSLNTLDVLQLHYAVALFPLLMIALVVLCVRMRPLVIVLKLVQRCCKPSKLTTITERFLHQRRMGQSLLHAFAAFVLLSYTKFTLSSTYILNYQYLVMENGSAIEPPRPVFAGQFTVDDRQYKIRYLLPAVIVLATFVAIPPLLLLHYPLRLLERCINRVHCLRRLYPADKVHILLDTFQGCYKNNMRFFAGLYFVFRLAINASYILTSQMVPRYCFQQITCTVYVLLVALCQPYTRKFLNYVDILIFTNLAIINTLSTLMYTSFQPDDQFQLAPFAVQYILIFLPLVYMIMYVIWYLMNPHLEKIKTCVKTCAERGRHDIAIAEVDRETSEASHDDMEALWKRAERENTYRAPAQEKVEGENAHRVPPPRPNLELQYPGSVGEMNSESRALVNRGELGSYGTFEGT